MDRQHLQGEVGWSGVHGDASASGRRGNARRDQARHTSWSSAGRWIDGCSPTRWPEGGCSSDRARHRRHRAHAHRIGVRRRRRSPRRCPGGAGRLEPTTRGPEEPLSRAAIVTPHQLSAEAGRHILLSGGNAADAAVAIVAAQGVVAPETCGIGGDLFALIHARGEEAPLAINASGRSGSGADAAILRDLGHQTVPREHPLTVTIPGCVDGLQAISERVGTVSMASCLEPAITLAKEGFAASTEQSRAFTAMAGVYRDNPAVADFYPDGEAVQAGDIVTRPQLGRTLQEIADGGRDAFYRGRASEDIIAVLGPHVTDDDLARSQFEWVDPIGIDIRDDVAWTLPPNSAGYLGPGTLAVFSRLDPPLDPTDPLWWHLLIEAHRSLAWERDTLVAEPRTAPIDPMELLSSERLDGAAEAISRDRAGIWPTRPAQPSGTAYMCVADDAGLAVSIIQSNYRGTGSPFGAARSGFLLQDRGGGFSLERGHPNELLPGKRPAHTLSPTLWTRDKSASWLLGTRGGEIQPQLVAQMGARAILGGSALEEAQRAPRWTMRRYGPGEVSAVSLEPGSDMAAHLRSLGHIVTEEMRPQPGWGPMGIIDLTGPDVMAAADPRVDTARALVL
ncbi:MAG: gamma-glutamyltranspeptidase [Actinobacteria bacterium]|nr:MAG: gamma-glutamyltranspeptidase [Actinomycetota bacterium]